MGPAPFHRLGPCLEGSPVRHSARVVGENRAVQPVSDGAGERARIDGGERTWSR